VVRFLATALRFRYLALLVDGQHDGVGRRVDIEADHVDQLGLEGRIAGALEGADAMRLKLVGLPDALHRAQREARGLRHGAPGPVRRLMRRRAAGQCDHPRHHLRRDGWRARRTGLVAQQAVDALLSEALLPTPDHGAADADLLGHVLHGPVRHAGQHNARPLDVLAGPTPIRRNGLQAPLVHRTHDHTYTLTHDDRIALPERFVNHQSVSVH